MTPKVWCIHNNEPSLKLVQDGFVSIGWEELGDLAELVSNKEALKTRLLDTFPDAKPGAIPGWAGTLRRFVLDMQIGDIVIAPNKSDRTLSLGTRAGDYYFDPSATLHPNRRKVTWHNTGFHGHNSAKKLCMRSVRSSPCSQSNGTPMSSLPPLSPSPT